MSYPNFSDKLITDSPCVLKCGLISSVSESEQMLCSGCGRFLSEIIGWNSFHDTQRHAVNSRLITQKNINSTNEL
jgi:predicted Fe-S protein YdhL (DUF1289 family)